ncbi:hypothetical protein GP486_008059 [Trichoglossum hirsutum]|uniref:Uncharacterized protein n=1 Tax=Trichoglossum hirsutum TaxID=265104 RepID=A0A9P8IEP1_9PEZI|nr:hypothetical protein GP486_008059 [Trichoglossum hirsutum]
MCDPFMGLMAFCPCTRPRPSEDDKPYPKTSASSHPEENDLLWHLSRCWRKLKASLVSIAPTSQTTCPSPVLTKHQGMPLRSPSNSAPDSQTANNTAADTGKIAGGDVAPQKPLEDPHEPARSQEQVNTSGSGKSGTHPPPEVELTKTVGGMLGQAPQTIVDVAIRGSKDKGRLLFRRAILDSGSYVNFMAGDVQRRLDTEMQPYVGSSEKLWQKEVEPLGRVEVEWRFVGHSQKTYRTPFLVIEAEDFDLLLGGPLIKEHQLNKAVAALHKK